MDFETDSMLSFVTFSISQIEIQFVFALLARSTTTSPYFVTFHLIDT